MREFGTYRQTDRKLKQVRTIDGRGQRVFEKKKKKERDMETEIDRDWSYEVKKCSEYDFLDFKKKKDFGELRY